MTVTLAQPALDGQSLEQPEPEPEPEELAPPKLEGEPIKVTILVTQAKQTLIPRGSRIVIAEIDGSCANEVKDALMARLIDNPDYSVLTRDFLDQIMGEQETNWQGAFDSETAAALGELMGASLWIVGRVTYCGPDFAGIEEGADPESFKVAFAVQIIELETARVLVSSSSEGTYNPSSVTKAAMAEEMIPIPVDPEETSEDPSTDQPTHFPSANSSSEQLTDLDSHRKFQAAQIAANGFADKFFSRPSWETVEMWQNDRWSYTDAIRFVQLGHCDRSVELLRGQGVRELAFMRDGEVSQYLHNFGIALLCANQLESAIDKLRAAYRINRADSTLRMLGIAGRLSEWSLSVEPEVQPEVDLIIQRRGR